MDEPVGPTWIPTSSTPSHTALITCCSSSAGSKTVYLSEHSTFSKMKPGSLGLFYSDLSTFSIPRPKATRNFLATLKKVVTPNKQSTAPHKRCCVEGGSWLQWVLAPISWYMWLSPRVRGWQGEWSVGSWAVKMSLATTDLVTVASILISPIKIEEQRVLVTKELVSSPAVGCWFWFWFCNLSSSSVKPLSWACMPAAVALFAVTMLDWNQLLTGLSSLLYLLEGSRLTAFCRCTQHQAQCQAHLPCAHKGCVHLHRTGLRMKIKMELYWNSEMSVSTLWLIQYKKGLLIILYYAMFFNYVFPV